MNAYFDFIEAGYDRNYTYLIGCNETKELALIDCAAFDYEYEDALTKAAENGFDRVNKVFLTHAHPDHVISLEYIYKKFQPEIYVHESEAERIKSLTKIEELTFIEGKQELYLGEEVLQTVHTPGHQESCICFIWRDKIFTGDTLFIEGCGRTDLPGGDTAKQFESMKLIATEIPENLQVHAGHNYGSTPVSTIGREKTVNPYLVNFAVAGNHESIKESWFSKRLSK